MPYLEWLKAQWGPVLNRIEVDVLTISALSQVGVIIAAFLIARFLAGHTTVWVERQTQHRKGLSLIRIHASYQEVFFLLFLPSLLWFAVLTAQGAFLPFAVMRTAATLATAWGIIRFTSSTIESAFWSRLIAVVLWILAALSIFGWLAPAIEIADRASFTVGTIRLSVLLLVKGAIAYGVIFWIVRFLSGVVDRGFEKATGMTPSQRVLFSKLSNIALYVAAVVVGLNIVGLDLTSLAVFSGALGLGIGFGLQKVVSNLISGIILLMDKSIKPGDVIAVGDSYGWVNSLGARCISVLTRDGKEHLIPNENLITQTVENWSYSDRKVRLHIAIGVSYNSDIHQVRKLLLQAVDEHARVLKIPEPRCLITGFGDSSIDFEIRAWIFDPQEGLTNLKSDIFYRVWDLFKENNIEIPFPQRDIHIRQAATPAA